MTGLPEHTPRALEITVGDALTPLELNVTSTVIVAGAIASRDFMPAHHDPAYARAQGAPDIYWDPSTGIGYETAGSGTMGGMLRFVGVGLIGAILLLW